MSEQKFIVSDPHCATKGGDIVARGFKSAANAQRWLDKKIAADPDGYAGCFVEPDHRAAIAQSAPRPDLLEAGKEGKQ